MMGVLSQVLLPVLSPLFKGACKVVKFAARRVRPRHPDKETDKDERGLVLRLLNVATCVPVALVPGFGVVGLIALFFHAWPRGPTRSALRRLDYWSIAATSTSLLGGSCTLHRVALLAAVPFAPAMLTACCWAAFEARAYLAFEELEPRGPAAWLRRRHVVYGLSAAACYAADGLLDAYLLHPAWHCLAAASLRSMVEEGLL